VGLKQEQEKIDTVCSERRKLEKKTPIARKEEKTKVMKKKLTDHYFGEIEETKSSKKQRKEAERKRSKGWFTTAQQ